MLLAQQFKTMEGARKRAYFENAHSRAHTYHYVRCLDGQEDLAPFDPDKFVAYTWRIKRLPRR